MASLDLALKLLVKSSITKFMSDQTTEDSFIWTHLKFIFTEKDYTQLSFDVLSNKPNCRHFGGQYSPPC
ncbi:hypothetical protein ACOSQ3_023387 [Xanthoceras sorbifolium]